MPLRSPWRLSFYSRHQRAKLPGASARSTKLHLSAGGGIAAMTSLVSSAEGSGSYSSTVTKLNESTTSMPKEAKSKPHHIIHNGSTTGFKNIYPSYVTHMNLVKAFKEVIWPLFTGQIQRPDTTPPTVPVVQPQWLPDRKSSSKLRATWLGHACYYVEFPSGLRVLFDPVFEDRCSPFSSLGHKRYTPPPCNIQDIPIVDAVIISHSHYDHLSHTSLQAIHKKHPNVRFFVGLGLEKWFRDSGLDRVTELDWWEEAELNITAGKENLSARISCLPCQHSSGRTLRDKDTTLWCSWGVKSNTQSVWFGGDTGYRAIPRLPTDVDDYGPEFDDLPRCPQFKQIGELRGPFDLGLIPVGAYFPRAAFSAVHGNPFDAVEIFQDTKCKRAMGIHWGTWVLTYEPVLEPPMLLKKALARKGLPETGVFDVCDIGESREF